MKNEKCFLSHLKSFFCSQGFYVFIMTFWLYRKNNLIRKIRLIFQYIIIIFKRLSIAINFLKPESAPSRNCHRGAEVQSISEKRLRSIREASKLRKDSLCSNLPSLNQDNLVVHKNCPSTYTSKTHIDRYLKKELSS